MLLDCVFQLKTCTRWSLGDKIREQCTQYMIVYDLCSEFWDKSGTSLSLVDILSQMRERGLWE
jgi:hypothetical protein